MQRTLPILIAVGLGAIWRKRRARPPPTISSAAPLGRSLTTAEVKARLDDYLSSKTLDESAKLKIEALWPDEAQPLDGGELLDRLTASLAVVEPKAAEVVTACRQGTAWPSSRVCPTG